MDLFLVNFEKEKNRIKNKKIQSEISKVLSVDQSFTTITSKFP